MLFGYFFALKILTILNSFTIFIVVTDRNSQTEIYLYFLKIVSEFTIWLQFAFTYFNYSKN